MKNIKLTVFLGLLLCLGCKKFLAEKADSKLATPTTLTDLQALLDHYQVLNQVDGATSEASGTDYYLTDADFATQNEANQRMYTWQKSNIYASTGNEWFYNYRALYRANSVIEFLGAIPMDTGNQQQWQNIKGMAHYYRAKNLLKTLFAYAISYNPTSASQDLGVPIRLSTDFNEKSIRESVDNGYKQVIADLQLAISNLPNTQSHVMRPNKPAAYALLARTYLSMNQYALAFESADASIKLKGDLMDYNTLTASATYPIAQFNVEVLHDSFSPATLLNNTRAKVSAEVMALYESNDIRSTVLFKNNGNGTFAFKGSYEGTLNPFSGVATDEVYLMRAECLARMNRLPEALADLNLLLKKRYRINTFIALQSTNQTQVTDWVLKERRKELLFRGLRWMDIKRLNLMGAGISLKKMVNGKEYALQPNDKGFALPIPDDVIALSGMPQNSY
ncbi:MAG: RagB/SusD family nutrient uptake outer membrane protein [Flavobacteriales bacterium]|nr:MAG: RagB/SusD family nutrient uptake outer membrane protein [Flavobacteriales bacterium]